MTNGTRSTMQNTLSAVALIVALVAMLAAGTSVAGGKKPPQDGGGDAPYSLTPLGVPPGVQYPYITVFGINAPDAQGIALAVGGCGDSNEGVATLWEVDETGGAGGLLGTVDLGVLEGYTGSVATGLNDNGFVVGYCTGGQEGKPANWPFVIVPSVGMIALPRSEWLGGSAWPRAYAINNLGQVVGQLTGPGPGGEARHGALWTVDASGNVSEPIGLGFFIPYDINELGVMAGEYDEFAAIAYFDDQNVFQVIELGRLANDHTYSRATAINNLGEVVGSSQEVTWDPMFGPIPISYAFVWTSESGMVGLGGVRSWAADINDLGQIVGHAHTANTDKEYATIWEGGVMTDLNALIPGKPKWRLLYAQSINSIGQVAGRGERTTRKDTEELGFVLTPSQ